MIEIWTYAVGLRIFGFCGCTPPHTSTMVAYCRCTGTILHKTHST